MTYAHLQRLAANPTQLDNLDSEARWTLIGMVFNATENEDGDVVYVEDLDQMAEWLDFGARVDHGHVPATDPTLRLLTELGLVSTSSS